MIFLGWDTGHTFSKFIFYCFLLKNALNTVKIKNGKRVSCVHCVKLVQIYVLQLHPKLQQFFHFYPSQKSQMLLFKIEQPHIEDNFVFIQKKSKDFFGYLVIFRKENHGAIVEVHFITHISYGFLIIKQSMVCKVLPFLTDSAFNNILVTHRMFQRLPPPPYQ